MTRPIFATAAFAVGLTLAAQARDAEPPTALTRGAGVPGELRQAPSPATNRPDDQRALLQRYCQGCHNERTRAGGLALDTLDLGNVGGDAARWERVVRKLRAGVMPPSGMPRPAESSVDRFLTWLEHELDAVAAKNPNPGRSAALHRLNRTEYRNAIRDLLALDIDVADYLPADDSSYGFDNIGGSLKMSQSLLERYLAAARTISRLAIGGPLPSIDATTYRLSPSLQQHERAEGLPFGTRGGARIDHLFPQDGDYDIRVELAGANRVRETYELELALDDEPIKRHSVSPRRPSRQDDGDGDPGKVELRIPVRAGPRQLGVSFLKKPNLLVEGLREPLPNPRFEGGPGGGLPTVASVTIVGPHNPSGPGDTPSRRHIFVCRPATAAEESPCARTILAALAKRAHRGSESGAVLEDLLGFYRQERRDGGTFDSAIEAALRSLLLSPQFLFRIEADPVSSASTGGRPYRISDLELASRLSFFLWSSVPDDALLEAARRGGDLSDPRKLAQQVRRMLQDPRSESLTTNFAAQWLQLRNLDLQRPGDPYSLAFDESLRHGLRRETELFFDSIVRENHSALELLTADYTFLNDRVAAHYGMPYVQGSHFRRVTLPADSPRRGILGHGSILTLTSHAIRTSPVIRGKWLLNTVLGTPPPDPPPNVPSLADERTQARVQTMRERMAQHRANPSCAACHSLIDPVGFALENFDAIGRWRTVDESFNPIDATGSLPDGTKFDGVADLRAALVRRPERFVTTLVERLLTYALGRGLDYYDMPTVRAIVRDAATSEFRMQSIILGIVQSDPFRMRNRESPQAIAAVDRQAAPVTQGRK